MSWKFSIDIYILYILLYINTLYIITSKFLETIIALNISNHLVEEKAILDSKITGKNKTATVEEALDYFLSHHSTADKANTNNEVIRLLEEMASLPVLDKRSADKILGYDQQGLPK